MYTISSGNRASGNRMMSNRDRHTKAFSADRTWSSPEYTYVANVTRATLRLGKGLIIIIGIIGKFNKKQPRRIKERTINPVMFSYFNR